jgi:hypothetical protein
MTPISCKICKLPIEDTKASSKLSFTHPTTKHEFHKDCISPWLSIRHECPTCRFVVPKSDDLEIRKIFNEAIYGKSFDYLLHLIKNRSIDELKEVIGTLSLSKEERGAALRFTIQEKFPEAFKLVLYSGAISEDDLGLALKTAVDNNNYYLTVSLLEWSPIGIDWKPVDDKWLRIITRIAIYDAKVLILDYILKNKDYYKILAPFYVQLIKIAIQKGNHKVFLLMLENYKMKLNEPIEIIEETLKVGQYEMLKTCLMFFPITNDSLRKRFARMSISTGNIEIVKLFKSTIAESAGSISFHLNLAMKSNQFIIAEFLKSLKK